MTREEIRAFYGTPVGKLLQKFINAHSAAWVTDQRETSPEAAMKRDWTKSNEALGELVAALIELQSHAHKGTTQED